LDALDNADTICTGGYNNEKDFQKLERDPTSIGINKNRAGFGL
jgi:hypothetical protein